MLIVQWKLKYSPTYYWWRTMCFPKLKHYQRHNGPEGWVNLAKVILQIQTQILIEFHLQNLDSASTRNLNQTSASPLNLKFKILTQPSFRISTKIQLHNLYKTSAAKCWTSSSFKILLNFNFKILTNPCAQSLKKSLVLGPNVSSQICNKLLPTWFLIMYFRLESYWTLAWDDDGNN